MPDGKCLGNRASAALKSIDIRHDYDYNLDTIRK